MYFLCNLRCWGAKAGVILSVTLMEFEGHEQKPCKKHVIMPILALLTHPKTRH